MKARLLSIPVLMLGLALNAWAKSDDVPEDYDGLLIKNDITAIMRGGDIEVTVTVMDKSILQYATKEIRDYLNKLIADNLSGNANYNPADPKCPIPFLVNFRALGQEVRYEPQQLEIFNYGHEFKPLDVIPVSPNFNDKVAYIRKPPVSAIYLFDRGIDLHSRDLSIVYFNSLVFNNWLKVIEKVNEAKTQYEVYRTRNQQK